MAYPRHCEGCGVQYTDFARQSNFAHVTLAAEDGGTSSPWLPEKPGRVLEIGCKFCGAITRWDYFGRAGDGRLGTSLALVRGPVENWRSDAALASPGSSVIDLKPQRRAS
jgi:hypothetical protein